MRSSTSPRYRRLLQATVLASFVAVLLTGLWPTSTADHLQPVPEPVIAEAFGTPAPHLGDRGVYTKEVFLQDGDARIPYLPEKEWAEFEWVPHAPEWDAAGVSRKTIGLRFFQTPATVHDFNATASDAVWLIDPEVRQAYAVTMHARSAHSESDGMPFNRKMVHSWFESHRVVTPGEKRHEPLFCGLFHDLQGAAHDPAVNTTLFPECRFARAGGPPSEVECTVIDDRAGPEGRVLVLEAPPAEGASPFGDQVPKERLRWYPFDPWTPSSVGVRVWLSDAVPYPVRMELQDPATGLQWVYRLSSFARGDAPFPGSHALRATLPPVEMAPVRPWGMDDSGIDHPYPLSEAYQDALDDPLFTELREFLDAYPDAQPSAVWSEVRYEDGKEIREWILDLQTPDGAGFRLDSETIRPQALPAAAETRSGYPYDVMLPPECPDVRALPTVASLAARAAIVFPDADPYELTYAYEEGCYPHVDQVTPLRVSVAMGARESESRPVEDRWHRQDQISYYHRGITFDEKGHMLSYERQEGATSQEGPREGQTKMRPVEGMQIASKATMTLPDHALSAPVAGTLAIAVASGAVYFHWYAIKTLLAAPLFSRIKRDKALDHPVRNELFHLIEAEPGLHFQELVRRTGHAEGQVQHHLKKLVLVELVTLKRTSGYTCYFPKGRIGRQEASALPFLKSKGARAIFTALCGRPAMTGGELTEATGLARQTVDYHLRRLVKAGVLQRFETDARIMYRTAEDDAFNASARASSRPAP